MPSHNIEFPDPLMEAIEERTEITGNSKAGVVRNCVAEELEVEPEDGE